MPPPARPPDREEGHVIIRVPSRQSYRRSRSRPRPADAADAHRNSENDEDDARSAASSISALSMGTARPHRATGNSTNVNSNRAGSTRAAAVGAVIGAEYGESGSAAGIDVAIPDLPDRGSNNCRNAASNVTIASGGYSPSSASRPGQSTLGNNTSRGRQSNRRQLARERPLPILPEDDSSDSNAADEENARRSRNQNQTRSRQNTNVRAQRAEGEAKTPYVTDIGYSDDDTRHTVASQRYTPIEQLGQRYTANNRTVRPAVGIPACGSADQRSLL